MIQLRKAKVVAWLFASACVGATSCRPPDPSEASAEARRFRLDVATGSVQGTISWGGAPLGTAESFALLAYGDAINQVLYSNSYQFETVPAGERTLGLYSSSCADPAGKLGGTTFTVAAGSTTSADLDLTATAGRVTGTIHVNGAPLPGAVLQFRSGSESCNGYSDAVTLDPSGTFARLLSPRSYVAEIHGPAGVIGSTSFVVSAGATKDLGLVDVQTGGVAGTLLWNEAPVRPQEASLLYLWGGSIRHSSDGVNYELREVAPGDYSVGLYNNAALATYNRCIGDATAKLGDISFTVSPGSTTAADIDLTTRTGRVAGLLRINGVPLADAKLEIHLPGQACFTDIASADGSGFFSRLLTPGTYAADIHGALGIIGSVSFTVGAGAPTDLGDVNVRAGRVQGTIVWNGAPIDPREAFQLYAYEPGAFSQQIDGSAVLFSTVSEGNHTVSLYNTRLASYDTRCIGDPANKLGETSFAVAAGSTTNARFDLSSTTGRLAASIRANGASLADARLEILPTTGSACGGDIAHGNTDGTFSRLLTPQPYYANVWTASGYLASFSFVVLAGQTTNVDSINTPVGTGVPLSLLGGTAAVNGLSLKFSNVIADGNTVVVQSGTCADPLNPCSPPPTGYLIAGAHYWDLFTTASYAGPIEVCFHYDQEEVCGSGIPSCAKESRIVLLHDAGAGFTNVTKPGSPDTTANIICGVTPSLSPFAIGVPVSEPDTPPSVTVPADIVAEAAGPGGAIVTFSAAAADAEDGALPVVCTPASGSTFAPGKTTVTCSAADVSGNPATATFTVWVQYQAPTGGTFFLQPINPDGSSIFKRGSTIPVKFKLTGVSAGITNLGAHLSVAKISNSVTGSYVEAASPGAANSGSTFRYDPDGNLYIFNLSTKGLSTGTWSLRVSLGDGVDHAVGLSLR